MFINEVFGKPNFWADLPGGNHSVVAMELICALLPRRCR
jgi:hypothetical protein